MSGQVTGKVSYTLRLNSRFSSGFTIVELLIVIVVIGVLAAITLVSFNGIQERARIAAIQSDLEQAAKQLEAYRFTTSANEQYPPDQATANLKVNSDVTLNYQVNNNTAPPSYCLTAVNGNLSYRISSTNMSPTVGTCSGVLASGISCPSGFIVVPGNSAFGTSEFCVMKYEAKQASATVPISQASGTPWVSISQTDAITYSANVAGCSGCHLITEAEWLTIAANVLAVPSNWSGNSVGVGYVYSGHSDFSPATLLSSNDTDGYFGTGDSSSDSGVTGGMVGASQRRTLTLSNGEVIWDMSGNSFEWTTGSIAGGQQPGLSGESTYTSKDYNNGSLIQNGLSDSAYPSFGVPAASGWTASTNGIGNLLSNSGEVAARAYFRGGSFASGNAAGIFSLSMAYTPSSTIGFLGFRVSR